MKEIRDKAEALRAYARQAGESLEMQNQCAEIKIRAERRAGEMLGDMELVGVNQHNEEGVSSCNTLADIGVTRIQSHRWQTIASVPETEFEKHVADDEQKPHIET